MHLAQFSPLCRRSAKNYQNWWKFDEVATKTILHSFFETQCRLLREANARADGVSDG